MAKLLYLSHHVLLECHVFYGVGLTSQLTWGCFIQTWKRVCDECVSVRFWTNQPTYFIIVLDYESLMGILNHRFNLMPL